MANVDAMESKRAEFEEDLRELLSKHDAEMSIDLDVIEVSFMSGDLDIMCFTCADATGIEGEL